MKRFRNPFLRMILLLLPCGVLVFSVGASESAVLERFCQYPPYVVQTVLPSVTLLVSNSQSMGKFAYGDPDPSRACDTAATACRGFDPTKKYYGIFHDNAYYTNAGSNSAAGSGFSFAGWKGTYTKDSGGNKDWDGNLLNWLTTRRIDVMKKVLTGGTFFIALLPPCMNDIFMFIYYHRYSRKKYFIKQVGENTLWSVISSVC